MTGGAPTQRSRIVEGSCWTCRRLRVKCDLSRPKCRRCSIGHAPCHYGRVPPVKWVGAAAIRGRNVANRSPDENREAIHPDNNGTPLLVPPPALGLSSEELLTYFANAVMPRYQLMEEILPLDIKAISHDEPLRQAVLAVAQAHHDISLHATSKQSLVCRRRARHSAIHTLRQRLDLGLDGQITAQQLLPVNVLLCILDGMIEPEEAGASSVCHLKGGYALIQGNAQIPATMLQRGGLEAHLLSVFATMDLVHALLSGEKPYFDPFIWHMFSETPAWFGRLDSNDRFLALLKTFSEMASLGHLIASQLPAEHCASLVERCIPSIEMALSAKSTPSASSTQRNTISPKQWEMFCDLYELSATIYMHRALRRLPTESDAIQAAVREGVEILSNESLPGMMAHCVIFPMLVIGVHATNAPHQRAVVRALSPSKDYLSFGNLQIMADSLKEVWSTPASDVDANWWQCFKRLSSTVFLF